MTLVQCGKENYTLKRRFWRLFLLFFEFFLGNLCNFDEFPFFWWEVLPVWVVVCGRGSGLGFVGSSPVFISRHAEVGVDTEGVLGASTEN